MQLSRNFSLAEFTRSNTAARLGLSNTPPADLMPRLIATAEELEKVRTALGDGPITVLSGFRSFQVNKAVGGSNTSAHCLGFAVDFKRPGMTVREVVLALKKTPLKFDQLIDEFGQWVHIGFGPGERQRLRRRWKAERRAGQLPPRQQGCQRRKNNRPC